MSDRANRWIIKRNCSATPAQLAWVLGSMVGVSFLFGAAFAAAGYWMILPFVGIELLAVAAAFLVYGRHAADFETIEIADGCVRLEQVEGGQRRSLRLPAAGTRIEFDDGVGRSRLVRVFLAARAQRVEIGAHLRDERRIQLARELSVVLGAALRPPAPAPAR